MSGITVQRDQVDRLARLEELVRMLRLRQGSGVPWFSLEDYLCGGWFDPFTTGTQRPYKTDLSVPDESWAAGFYDLGYGLLFTGVVMWDPFQWWPGSLTDIANNYGSGASGGDPDIGCDSFQLFNTCDGFGNSAGSPKLRASYDLGNFLPYTLWRDLDQPANGIDASDWTGHRTLIKVPTWTQSGSRPGDWTDDAWAQFGIGNTHITDTMYAEMNTSGGVTHGGAFGIVDASGYTHLGVPAGTQLDLTGAFIPYGYGDAN